MTTESLIDRINALQTFKLFNDIGEVLVRRNDVIAIMGERTGDSRDAVVAQLGRAQGSGLINPVPEAAGSIPADLAPANTSEISGDENKALKALFYLRYSHGCWCTDRDPGALGHHSLGCDYARAAWNAKPEPVSVSLEKCGDAILLMSETGRSSEWRDKEVNNIAKAVLDAAGVAHVD